MLEIILEGLTVLFSPSRQPRWFAFAVVALVVVAVTAVVISRGG